MSTKYFPLSSNKYLHRFHVKSAAIVGFNLHAICNRSAAGSKGTCRFLYLFSLSKEMQSISDRVFLIFSSPNNSVFIKNKLLQPPKVKLFATE